jgi:hypothetical protein
MGDKDGASFDVCIGVVALLGMLVHKGSMRYSK